MAAIPQRVPGFHGECAAVTHGDSNRTDSVLLPTAENLQASDSGANVVATSSSGSTSAPHDDLTPQFSVMRMANFDPAFSFDCERPPACPVWQRTALPDMSRPPNRIVEPEVYANKRARRFAALSESEPRRSSLVKRSERLVILDSLRHGECTSGVSTVVSTPALELRSALAFSRSNLLQLPPEIRNLIFNILVVRFEPLIAQVRRVHHLKKGRRSNTISKFPLEPAIARVNRQLREEVLSIFYGSNHFIFEKTSYKMFTGLSMTNPSMVDRWRPPTNIALAITRLDLRYSAYSSAAGMTSIVYAIRRSHDSTINISIEVDQETAWSESPLQQCICAEFAIRNEVLSRIDGSADLTKIAINLMKRRLDTLFASLSVKQSDSRYSSHGSCEICHLPEFEILYSGI